LPIKLSR
jgi:hypothetical protein